MRSTVGTTLLISLLTLINFCFSSAIFNFWLASQKRCPGSPRQEDDDAGMRRESKLIRLTRMYMQSLLNLLLFGLINSSCSQVSFFHRVLPCLALKGIVLHGLTCLVLCVLVGAIHFLPLQMGSAKEDTFVPAACGQVIMFNVYLSVAIVATCWDWDLLAFGSAFLTAACASLIQACVLTPMILHYTDKSRNQIIPIGILLKSLPKRKPENGATVMEVLERIQHNTVVVDVPIEDTAIRVEAKQLAKVHPVEKEFDNRQEGRNKYLLAVRGDGPEPFAI